MGPPAPPPRLLRIEEGDPSAGGPDPETLRQRLHTLALVSRLSAPSALAFVLVGLLAAAHVGLLLLAPRSVHGGLHPAALLFAGAKEGSLVAAGEWWRLLAAGWLHASWGHLLVNAAGLLLLSQAAVNVLGAWRTVAILTLGGAASFGASTLASTLPSVGASGAVHALLGALVAFAVRHRRRLPREAWPWLFALGALWACLAVLTATADTTTDMAAHAGGFGTGAALGLLLSGNPRLFTGGPERRPLPVALLGAGCAGASLAALGMSLAGAALHFDLPDPALREFRAPDLRLPMPTLWALGHLQDGVCQADPDADPVRLADRATLCLKDAYGAVLVLGPAAQVVPGVLLDPAMTARGGLRSFFTDTEGDVTRRWLVVDHRWTLALLCYTVVADKYDGMLQEMVDRLRVAAGPP